MRRTGKHPTLHEHHWSSMNYAIAESSSVPPGRMRTCSRSVRRCRSPPTMRHSCSVSSTMCSQAQLGDCNREARTRPVLCSRLGETQLAGVWKTELGAGLHVHFQDLIDRHRAPGGGGHVLLCLFRPEERKYRESLPQAHSAASARRVGHSTS